MGNCFKSCMKPQVEDDDEVYGIGTSVDENNNKIVGSPVDAKSLECDVVEPPVVVANQAIDDTVSNNSKLDDNLSKLSIEDFIPKVETEQKVQPKMPVIKNPEVFGEPFTMKDVIEVGQLVASMVDIVEAEVKEEKLQAIAFGFVEGLLKECQAIVKADGLPLAQ